MKITRIEIFRANLPLKRPFRISLGLIEVTDIVFVRIHGEGELYGMGEANPLAPVVGETMATTLAACNLCARLLIGGEAHDIDGHTARLRVALPHNTTARSAFDMALYDLLGKAANLPLHALLGGPKRQIVTDNTVGIDTPETMARHAVEFRDRGFGAIKVKLGTAVAEDVARIAAIRKAVGPDILLRIDANQGWSRVDAHAALARIAPFDVQYCEQPVKAWDLAGLAEVSAASPIPVMADEALFDDHDAVTLLRADACRYFNIKLAKSAGIHTALRINAVAEAAGVPCMVGCMTETRLGLTAAAHLVSARPNIVFADLDGADMLRDDPVKGGIVYSAGGTITLPDGPGIGADIDAEFLAGLERMEVTPLMAPSPSKPPLMQLQSPLGPRMVVDGREVDYFCGTSYHALHGHPEVIAAANAANCTYGLGLGTRADVPAYRELDAALCGFFGVEATTYAISGYVSPLILLQGIRDDFQRVFVDAAAHYGIGDALATVDRPVHRFRHRDPQDLADKLAHHLAPGEIPMIVTDGVFPSTGALAPLADYAAVMARYDGALMCVDDAHGVGAIGATGGGTMELAGVTGAGRYLVGTTSKAFGGAGGFIPGSQALADRLAASVHLLAGASPPPPASAAAATAGIALVRGNHGLLDRLATNVARMRNGLRGLGLAIADSPVPIVSLTAERDLDELRVALSAQDILVKRVAPGGYSDAPDRESLRIAVFSCHTPTQIDRLIGAVGALL